MGGGGLCQIQGQYAPPQGLQVKSHKKGRFAPRIGLFLIKKKNKKQKKKQGQTTTKKNRPKSTQNKKLTSDFHDIWQQGVKCKHELEVQGQE